MLRINHMLLLLILLASPMDSQIITFLVTFCFTCTSAGSRTHHFIHHQFAHLRTDLRSTYLIQKLANGAPTLHQFSMTILPSVGHAFHTGAPVSVFVHLFQKLFIIYYLLYKHFFSTFFVVTVGDFSVLAIRNPCRPWIGAVLIINPCRHRPHLQSTQPVSYPYPLHLFTLSRLWHNLVPVLSSTYYSTLLHGCGHYFLHISSNQGQS
jgi:hypothetical protein